MSEINKWNLRTDEDAIIIGMKGHGKSTLLKLIMKNLLNAGQRVFLYDSEKEFGNLRHPLLQVYQPKINNLCRLSFIQKMKAGEKDRIKDEFDPICKAIYEKGNITLIITSIERYAPVHRELSNYFGLIVNEGRKRGIGLLVESRRPATLNKDACAQNVNWFMFTTYLPNDIKWLKEFVGELTKKLILLPKYSFIRWSTGTGAQYYTPLNPRAGDF